MIGTMAGENRWGDCMFWWWLPIFEYEDINNRETRSKIISDGWAKIDQISLKKR